MIKKILKRNVILFFTLFFVSFNLSAKNAKSYDFNEKVYGKMSVGLSYAFQMYSGDMKKSIQEAEDDGKKVSKMAHSLTLSAGYNLFYRYSDLIHPFAGLQVVGKIPLSGGKMYGKEDGSYFKELGRIIAKGGVKFNVLKNFSLIPYGVFGMNVNIYDFTAISKKGSTVGFTVGGGLETLIYQRFTFAVEYRYAYGKACGMQIDTHSVAFRVGAALF